MAIGHNNYPKQSLCWVSTVVLSLILLGSCSIPADNTPESSPDGNRSSLFAPLSFQEGDVVGHWETLPAQHIKERLIITADHHFIQIFDESPSSSRYQGEGTWWIEQRPSGCTYLHMHGMRFFYGGDGTIPLWELCEQRGIQMSETLILLVAQQPRLPRNIELVWPGLSGYEQSGMSMWLVADENGQPIPRSTPSSP